MKLVKLFERNLASIGLLIIAIIFFWLYRNTYEFGFFGEDYAWLHWVEITHWTSILKPELGTYYRPIAANIPYYFFSGSALGLFLWKILNLLLALSGTYALLQSRRVPSLFWLSVLVGAFWLLGPFQPFSAFYINAFDYRIYPVTILFFLYAVKRETYFLALVWLTFAIFSKEQGIGLALFPLFLSAKPTRKYWIGTAILLGLFLFTHHGFISSSGYIGGFPVGLAYSNRLKNAQALLEAFVGGSSSNGWELIWNTFAWAFCGSIATILILKRDRSAVRKLSLYLLGVLCLHVPLLFLQGLHPRNLGSSFWAFMFFGSLEACATLSLKNIKQLLTLISIGTAIGFGCAIINLPESELFYKKEESLIRNFITSTDPFLNLCNKTDRVVVQNLTKAMGGAWQAKNALWALRWRHPQTRFYLLRPTSLNIITDPNDPYLWADEWRTKGHPTIKVNRTENGFEVNGSGLPGCGSR